MFRAFIDYKDKSQEIEENRETLEEALQDLQRLLSGHGTPSSEVALAGIEQM